MIGRPTTDFPRSRGASPASEHELGGSRAAAGGSAAQSVCPSPSARRGTRGWGQDKNVSSEYTTNYTPPDKLRRIYNRSCTGSAATKCNDQVAEWENLRASAQTEYGGPLDARYLRFRNTGNDWGVAH